MVSAMHNANGAVSLPSISRQDFPRHKQNNSDRAYYAVNVNVNLRTVLRDLFKKSNVFNFSGA
jgi:hypothetical protein